LASNPFVGTWKLVSSEIETGDGQRSLTRGPEDTGYIMYNPDGYMSVTISGADRDPFAANDPAAGAIQEQAAAFATYFSYCGPYEVLADRVIHHVEISLFPNQAGVDLVRFYRFDGNRLILKSPPAVVDGQTRVTWIIWERVVD
jgi:hypothetical protein